MRRHILTLVLAAVFAGLLLGLWLPLLVEVARIAHG